MFQNILFDLFIIAMFIVGVYSFLIMPRQREFKRRQQLVRTLKVGSEVLTYGGLLGTIKNINTETGIVTVEVAKGLELRFIAAAIVQEFDETVYAVNAQKHMK